MTVRRIGVVAKRGLTAAAPHLVEVARWLIERDVAVRMDPETAFIAGLTDVPTSDRADLPRHVDLVLVLGGDGTLLGMADAVGAAGTGIPILGVNFGRLGFLTEVTLDELFPALEVVLSGNAQVSERAMLRAKILAGGAVVDEQLVLNDVVVTRGAISRVVDLAVTVDGGFVTRIKGDGIIIASPTGSTAYNLAANGPIIHPDVDALVLTPIAPHMLSNRPIVIPGSSTVEISPLDDGRQPEVFATFDGRAGREIRPGDVVRISRAQAPVRLVSSATRSYYDTLRLKLGWGER